MWIKFVIAAAVGCAISAAGWTGYVKGYEKRDLKAKAEMLVMEQKARATEQLMNQRVQEAQANETKRRSSLQRDVDAAHRAVYGLQQQLAQANRELSTASVEASRQYAITVNELFGQCTAAYQGMAEQADKHSSDSLMLQEAWPQY